MQLLSLVHTYLIRYDNEVIEIRQTHEYFRWFDRLRDRQARFRILARIRRLSLGNPGDAQPVGDGISELRIDCGPGYRVYFKQLGTTLMILLAGGDKSTQKRDIEKARELARGL
jgi:putative addiction module killer protein